MQATDVQMIADRWMLESRRLINWAPMRLPRIPPLHGPQAAGDPARRASESGKSTLVDAQISLLYPTGTPFNKASNSGRSERSDYTYLRGMVGVGSSRNRRPSRSTCAAATRTAHRNPCGAPSWTPIATRPPARCSPAPNSST